MSNILENLKAKFRALYEREPARVNAAVVSVVLAIAGIAGLVVGAPLVTAIGLVVAFVAPAVVAELTRPKVTPVDVAVAVADDAYEVGRSAGRAEANLGE